MSVSGRSTSSKTRCSGSANDVAVYCIRAVRSSAPHAHSGSATRLRSAARPPPRQRHREQHRGDQRPPAISPGAIDPDIPGSRTTAPKSVKPTGVARRAARRAPRATPAPQRTAPPPSATQAAAAIAMPATHAARGFACAGGAGCERGRARKPMPNALTIAATPRPVVSATAPTASGAVSATSGVVARRGAWISDCTSSHSLTKPAPSGSPARTERGHPEQDRRGGHLAAPARRAGRGRAARSPRAPNRRPGSPGS